MIGYAVKADGSWCCIDIDTMPLEPNEVFQDVKPPIINKELA